MPPYREWKDPTAKLKTGQLREVMYAENRVCSVEVNGLLSVFLPLLEAEGPPPLRDAYVELLEKHWGGNPTFAGAFDAAYNLYEAARQTRQGVEAFAHAQFKKALHCGIEHDNGRDCNLVLDYRLTSDWLQTFEHNGIPPFLAVLQPMPRTKFEFRTFHCRAALDGDLYRWADAVAEDLMLAGLASELILANIPNKAKYTAGSVLASLFPGWADAVGIKPRLPPSRIDIDPSNRRQIERLLDRARLVGAHAKHHGDLRLVALCYNEAYEQSKQK